VGCPIKFTGEGEKRTVILPGKSKRRKIWLAKKKKKKKKNRSRGGIGNRGIDPIQLKVKLEEGEAALQGRKAILRPVTVIRERSKKRG